MTPAQRQGLAVILDHARELFGDDARAAIVRGLYDEATVVAESGFVWVLQRHYDYAGEGLEGVYATEAAARDAARENHRQAGWPEQSGEFHEHSRRPGAWVADSGSGELWLTKEPLSPAETPAAASVSRPQGETP